jgi:hypothetical protein
VPPWRPVATITSSWWCAGLGATAGSHVEHIYTKIGASNRAQASLFAMKHGLMSEWSAARLERPSG